MRALAGRPRLAAVAATLALLVLVFLIILPLVEDRWIAAIMAGVASLLPAFTLLGSGSRPVRRHR